MSKRRTHRVKRKLIIAYQQRMLAQKQKERRARRRRLVLSFVSSTLNKVITRRCERLDHHEATYLDDESHYNSIKYAKLQKDSQARVVSRQRQTRLPAAVMTKLFRRARLIRAQRLSTRVRRNARTCVRRYQRTHSRTNRRLLRFSRQALKIRRRLYHYRQQRGRRRPVSARLAVRAVRLRVVPRRLMASQPRLRRAVTRIAHYVACARNLAQRQPPAASRRCIVLRARLAALAPKTFCSAPYLSARAIRHKQRLSAVIVAKTLHTWRRLRLASSASRRRCRSRRKSVIEIFKLRRIRLAPPAERVLSGVEIKYEKKVARQDVRDDVVEDRWHQRQAQAAARIARIAAAYDTLRRKRTLRIRGYYRRHHYRRQSPRRGHKHLRRRVKVGRHKQPSRRGRHKQPSRRGFHKVKYLRRRRRGYKRSQRRHRARRAYSIQQNYMFARRRLHAITRLKRVRRAQRSLKVLRSRRRVTGARRLTVLRAARLHKPKFSRKRLRHGLWRVIRFLRLRARVSRMSRRLRRRRAQYGGWLRRLDHLKALKNTVNTCRSYRRARLARPSQYSRTLKSTYGNIAMSTVSVYGEWSRLLRKPRLSASRRILSRGLLATAWEDYLSELELDYQAEYRSRAASFISRWLPTGVRRLRAKNSNWLRGVTRRRNLARSFPRISKPVASRLTTISQVSQQTPCIRQKLLLFSRAAIRSRMRIYRTGRHRARASQRRRTVRTYVRKGRCLRRTKRGRRKLNWRRGRRRYALKGHRRWLKRYMRWNRRPRFRRWRRIRRHCRTSRARLLRAARARRPRLLQRGAWSYLGRSRKVTSSRRRAARKLRKHYTILPYRRSLSRGKLLRRTTGKQRVPINKRAKKSKKVTSRKKQHLRWFKKGGSIRLKRRSARRKRLRAFGRLPLWRPSADYDLSNRAVVQHALESLLEKNRKFKKLFRRRLNVRRLPLAVRAYRFKRAQKPITRRPVYCPAAQFTNSLIAPRRRLFVRMLQRRGRWRRRKKLRRLLRRRRPTVVRLVPVHTSRLLPPAALLSSRAHLADRRVPYRPSAPLFSTKTSEPATAHLGTELKQLFTVVGPNLRQRQLHLLREILVDRAQTSAARLHQEYRRNLRKKNYVQVRTEANKDRRARIARVKKVKIKLRQATQGYETRRRFAAKGPEAKKASVARQAAERFRSRWYKYATTEVGLLYSHLDWAAYIRRRKRPSIWRAALLRHNHKVSLQKDLEKISEF